MNKKAEIFLLNLVKNNYDDIADDFNETRKKPMKPMVYEIVNILEFKEENKILDLGCGNGCFIEVLRSLETLKFSYLGIDNSEGLINCAKEKNNSEMYSFFKFDLSQLENLAEDNFSHVFSWAVLHHLPGQKLQLKFINNIYDKLADDGIFVFSIWKLRQKNNFFWLSLKSFLINLIKGRIIDWGDLIFTWGGKSSLTDKKKSLRYYHAFSKKSLKHLIKKSKFYLNGFKEDDFNYYFILKK